LIHVPTPELIEQSPAYKFENAAQESVRDTREALPPPTLRFAELTEQSDAGAPARTPDLPGAGIAPAQKPEGKAEENREARAAHSKIRTPGLYRKALSLSSIVRQQFRQLASFLTSHAPDPRRALKRMTSTDGGSAAKPHSKHVLRSEASTVVEFLSETLDWLNLWNHDTAFAYDGDDDFQQFDDHDKFYPQP
jgi:hypothetical protein